MNHRHDQHWIESHAACVVAQSSRSQTSHADHSGSAAHILRSSQEHFGCHTRHARLFFKPGHQSLDGQHADAWRTFTPDHTRLDPQAGLVRRSLQHGQMADGIHRMLAVRSLTSTQSIREVHGGLGWHFFNATRDWPFPSLDPLRVIHGDQESREAHPFLVAFSSREPVRKRVPSDLRSRPSYCASQNLPERLLQRACAHLPLVPDQHDQEETWTST